MDLLKAEMKGWMPRGCESCFQRKPYFISCSRKERTSGRDTEKYIQTWLGESMTKKKIKK